MQRAIRNMGLEGREELRQMERRNVMNRSVHNRKIKRIFGTMVNIKLWNFKGILELFLLS